MAVEIITGRPFTGKDLTGQVFGRLTVIRLLGFSRPPSNPNCRKAMWECRCVEDNVICVSGDNLKSGNSKSCGCLERDLNIQRNTKHGHSPAKRSSPIYAAWQGMLTRCKPGLNSRRRDAGWYYEKGIRVCERWHTFANFLEDMGPTWRDGLTVDRKDTSLDYCKENCKWSTWKEQANNRTSNLRMTLNGETLTLTQWAERYSTKPDLVNERIKRGWTLIEALTTPKKQNPPHILFHAHFL